MDGLDIATGYYVVETAAIAPAAAPLIIAGAGAAATGMGATVVTMLKYVAVGAVAIATGTTVIQKAVEGFRQIG